MKTEYAALKKQADAQLIVGTTEQALENYKTLALLLSEDRSATSEEKESVRITILQLENPEQFRQNQRNQVAAELAQRKAEKELADLISATNQAKSAANNFFSQGAFDQACEKYAEYAALLKKNPETNPGTQADAYWNLGTAYESLGCSKSDPDLSKIDNFKTAMSMIQKAQDTYPKRMKNDRDECQKALNRLQGAVALLSKTEILPAPSVDDTNITERVAAEIDSAFVSIFNINKLRQPIELNYPQALKHIQTALQLLTKKGANLSAIFSGRNCRWENVPHTKVNPVYDPYTGAHIQNQIIDYTTPEWICR